MNAEMGRQELLQLSSRRLLSAFGRAEAPVVASELRPVFSSELDRYELFPLLRL